MSEKEKRNRQLEPPQAGRIEFLSTPLAVSMADEWFEFAALDHFWIKRRFDILEGIAKDCLLDANRLAEIGCGHGILQRQIEDSLGKPVDGFDLNVHALERNVSRKSRIICYNVFDQRPELCATCDAILLFDVLEHLEQESKFLVCVKHLLKQGGKLVVNVPAEMFLHSVYDDVAGHLRRYSSSSLAAVVTCAGFRLVRWTYWGMPLIPLLFARKLALRKAQREQVIRRGFAPPSRSWNKVLLALSRAERIPQHLAGTSIMAVFEKTE